MISRAHLTPSISCVMPAFNEARNLGGVGPHTLAMLQKLIGSHHTFQFGATQVPTRLLSRCCGASGFL